ncbi:hypothetical protein Q9966_010130 [Columba livia]|nr:hypothetical protein Q9966_010130 [Columba livia]
MCVPKMSSPHKAQVLVDMKSFSCFDLLVIQIICPVSPHRFLTVSDIPGMNINISPSVQESATLLLNSQNLEPTTRRESKEMSSAWYSVAFPKAGKERPYSSEAACDVLLELAMLRAADAVRTCAELTSAELTSPALARELARQKLLLKNADVPVIMNTYFSQKVLLSEHSETREKTYGLTKMLIRKHIVSLAQTFRLDDPDDELHQESSDNQVACAPQIHHKCDLKQHSLAQGAVNDSLLEMVESQGAVGWREAQVRVVIQRVYCLPAREAYRSHIQGNKPLCATSIINSDPPSVRSRVNVQKGVDILGEAAGSESDGLVEQLPWGLGRAHEAQLHQQLITCSALLPEAAHALSPFPYFVEGLIVNCCFRTLRFAWLLTLSAMAGSSVETVVVAEGEEGERREKFENNVKRLLCPEIAYVKCQSRTAFNITNLIQRKLNMEGHRQKIVGGRIKLNEEMEKAINRQGFMQDTVKVASDFPVCIEDAYGMFSEVQLQSLRSAEDVEQYCRRWEGKSCCLAGMKILQRTTRGRSLGLFSLIDSLWPPAVPVKVPGQSQDSEMVTTNLPPPSFCYILTIQSGEIHVEVDEEEQISNLYQPPAVCGLKEILQIDGCSERCSFWAQVLYLRQKTKHSVPINQREIWLFVTDSTLQNVAHITPKVVAVSVTASCVLSTEITEALSVASRLVFFKDALWGNGRIICVERTVLLLQKRLLCSAAGADLSELTGPVRLDELDSTTQANSICAVRGTVVGVNESTAFSWPTCDRCGNGKLELCPQIRGLLYCNQCSEVVVSPVLKMQLEVFLSCPSRSQSTVKVKSYEVQSVLGKEVELLNCYVHSVTSHPNCVALEEIVLLEAADGHSAEL